jgi:hypothetical protein
MPYSGFGAEGEPSSASSTIKLVAVAGLALLAGWWLGTRRRPERAAAPRRARGRRRRKNRRGRRR